MEDWTSLESWRVLLASFAFNTDCFLRKQALHVLFFCSGQMSNWETHDFFLNFSIFKELFFHVLFLLFVLRKCWTLAGTKGRKRDFWKLHLDDRFQFFMGQNCKLCSSACINSFAKLAGMIMLCSFFSFLKSISSSIYANNVCALARWTKKITERFMLENSPGNCLLCCGICFSATYPPKGNESVTYDNKMKALLKYFILVEKVLK